MISGRVNSDYRMLSNRVASGPGLYRASPFGYNRFRINLGFGFFSGSGQISLGQTSFGYLFFCFFSESGRFGVGWVGRVSRVGSSFDSPSCHARNEV